MRQFYFDGIAFLSSVVSVDESTLDFGDNLSKNVGKHPYPDGDKRICYFFFLPEVLDSASLLQLVLVGQHKEKYTERNHDAVYNKFGHFYISYRLHLHWLSPELTMKTKVPSYPREKTA